MAVTPRAGRFRFGVFELDTNAGQLSRNGSRVRLAQQPLQVLCVLLDRRGEIVAREELHKLLWPADVFVDFDHGLNKSIQKIREALGDSPEVPRYIETIPRVGYRFIASVIEVSPPGVASEAPVASTESSSLGQLPTRDRKFWMRFGFALCAVIFVLVGGWIIWKQRPAVPSIRSLAVIPLDNLSGDPNQEYFADGMTDELITMLAKDSTLRITSRTSVMQYKGAHRSLPEIARALSVDGILEGSISRANGQVHMTLQLIRADTDAHIWAESYDRDATNAAGLPDLAATAIAARLNCKAPAHSGPRYIKPEAHDAYLRGHYDWVVGRNEDAGLHYRQAVDIQPDYALGWTGVADYFAQGAILGELDPREALPQAESAARKALELDDTLPRAHATLGGMIFFNHGDSAQALREISRATELDPNDSESLQLRAEILCALGRFDEAIAVQKQSIAINPFEYPASLAAIYLSARRFDAAISDADMRLKDRPADPDILEILAAGYHWKGQDTQAVDMLARRMSAQGDQAGAASIRRAFEIGGYSSVVRVQLAAAEKRAHSAWISPFEFADLHGKLKQHDETLALIEKGVNVRDPSLLLTIQSDPAFDFLHTDARYRSLIQKLGLPPLY